MGAGPCGRAPWRTSLKAPEEIETRRRHTGVRRTSGGGGETGGRRHRLAAAAQTGGGAKLAAAPCRDESCGRRERGGLNTCTVEPAPETVAKQRPQHLLSNCIVELPLETVTKNKDLNSSTANFGSPFRGPMRQHEFPPKTKSQKMPVELLSKSFLVTVSHGSSTIQLLRNVEQRVSWGE